MNCPECGFWNPPDQRICSRCAGDLPAPIPRGEAADDPGRPERPKVKSEVLELFDPSKQRDRKAPAGTRLIRRRRRDDEDGDDVGAIAVPGETGGGDAPLPEPPKRRKRTSRRLTVCTVCTAPFPARELLTVRNKLYCLPCLERREELFDPEEIADAKQSRAAKMAAAREREREEAEANPVRRRGTDTKRLAVQRRQAELALRGEASGTSHTAIIWPKCPRHPGHSTNDRCTNCRAPVCALCIKRQGSRTLCPGCAGSGSAPVRGTGAATSGSGLETLKDVLFSPLIFFRNLPSKGGIARPLLFGVLACFIGALVTLAEVGIWYGATETQAGPLTLVLQRPGPIAAGAAIIALCCAVLSALVHGIAGAALGGKADGGHSARGSFLACGPGWLGAIPVGGALLWPIFHLIAASAVLREIQDLNWFFSVVGALLGLAAQIAAGAAIAHFVFS